MMKVHSVAGWWVAVTESAWVAYLVYPLVDEMVEKTDANSVVVMVVPWVDLLVVYLG